MEYRTIVRDTASSQDPSACGLFFEPVNNGCASNTKGTLKTTQTTALLISPQYLFSAFFRIGTCLGIFATLAATRATFVFLFTIGRFSIVNKRFSTTMTTNE